MQTNHMKVNDNKKSAGIELIEWVESLVLALACVILLLTFVFRLVGVEGSSMSPTLNNNDRVIITNLFYTPKTGDIVVITQPKFNADKPLIKRVIATEGQTVDIDFSS